MGLFDKLFKKSKPQEEETVVYVTPDKILNSASSPVLPCFTVEEEIGDKAYSFRISEDFTVYEDSDMYPAYQYYPYTDDDYDGYDDVLPVIAIGANDKVYEACRAIENDEAVEDIQVEKLDGNQNFLFRTTFEEHGKIVYAYGFASFTAREREAFMLTYNPDVKGTALELKLRAALDNVIKTYTERDLDVL